MSELLSALDALPRVALLGGGPEHRELWPNAQQLAADSFATGARPELRFDVIVVPRPPLGEAGLSAWLSALGASTRAALIAVPALDNAHLRAALDPEQLLARASSATSIAPAAVAGTELWLVRGALGFPLLRVDDYPTGVRPI